MEISDEVWEIAQDLYDDADFDINRYGELESFTVMDFEDYNGYYRDCKKSDYEKAKQYLDGLLSSVKYYEGKLVLSDNDTLNNIPYDDIPKEGKKYNEDNFWEIQSFVYDKALQGLQEEIGTEVYGLGRSGKHICVDDNFKNLTKLDEYKIAHEKWEQWFIDEMVKELSYTNGEITESLINSDEKVAKCLSCGMKVKYRNRDVKHDAMGDYIECPNCKSTFDVDYDNTPTKKTEAEDYSAFTPTNKVLSGNKGLSEKAINEMRWSLPDLFKDMTDEQKQIWEELSLRGMVMSCLIYGEDIHTSTNINAVSKYYHQPYVNEYYDTLGKEVTEEIIKQQTEYFKKGKVIHNTRN